MYTWTKDVNSFELIVKRITYKNIDINIQTTKILMSVYGQIEYLMLM